MANVSVIVGGFFGDEGKGEIISYEPFLSFTKKRKCFIPKKES